ncbi:MAG: GNAT family N-acetyltransferase [Ruminococcus sp.]|nr:GNAT family N-acetyltransferase [Ruminococcus sp.]
MKLIRAGADDAQALWEMQVQAFSGLLEKYRDYGTSPAAEKLEKVQARLSDGSFFYFICEGGEKVGAIRIVVGEDGTKCISPLFIMQRFRRKGYAMQAIRLAENLHSEHNWALETIMQEKGSCRLYEKLGYKRTGRIDKINEYMDLVYYKKD